MPTDQTSTAQDPPAWADKEVITMGDLQAEFDRMVTCPPGRNIIFRKHFPYNFAPWTHKRMTDEVWNYLLWNTIGHVVGSQLMTVHKAHLAAEECESPEEASNLINEAEKNVDTAIMRDLEWALKRGERGPLPECFGR